MSQAVSMRPDLYAAYLHGASQWDGDYQPIAQNDVAVYIFMAENDEYYGSQKARDAYANLHAAYEKAGLTDSEIDQLLQLNIPDNAYFNAKGIYNYHGGGSVVFVNSNTAYRVIPDRIAYSASKSGQLGLMRALAFDLGKYNIRVNAVLPGMIRTDRWVKNPEFYAHVPSRYTPIGDVADGSDVADAVWYFAEHARVTTGAELVVDGGNTVQLYPIIPDKDQRDK